MASCAVGSAAIGTVQHCALEIHIVSSSCTINEELAEVSRLTLFISGSIAIGTVQCCVLKTYTASPPYMINKACEGVSRLTLCIFGKYRDGIVQCCEVPRWHCELLEVLRMALCKAVRKTCIVSPSYVINKNLRKRRH